MDNLRKYGREPFNVALVHGGPGAPGELAPVARELSANMGVLEPLQTASSVEGQVAELSRVLENHGSLPLILIGFSWGAWLSYIVTARHPLLVKKLILISSGPFEDKYAASIMATRLERLGTDERKEALSLLSALGSNDLKASGFAKFSELMRKADSCDPLPQEPEVLESGADVYQQVWGQASRLRSSGQLLHLGKSIRCPVVAIHGDHDPHPADGVRGPLARVLSDFRFVLLERCGHYPWLERNARSSFYDTLRKETCSSMTQC